MTRRARNGRFTAERTTERERVTERLTVELSDDTLEAIPAINWAAGLGGGPVHRPELWNAQRAGQQAQALDHLLMAVEHFGTEPVPEHWVREAVNILRAGPGASRAELTSGRSI